MDFVLGVVAENLGGFRYVRFFAVAELASVSVAPGTLGWEKRKKSGRTD
jgi:hypothetical protein